MSSHCTGAACADASDHRLTRGSVGYAPRRSPGAKCTKSVSEYLRISPNILRISPNFSPNFRTSTKNIISPDFGVLVSFSFDSIDKTTLAAQAPTCDPTGPHFSTRQRHLDFTTDKRVCGVQKLQSHPLAPEQRRMSFYSIMGCSATLVSPIFHFIFFIIFQISENS